MASYNNCYGNTVYSRLSRRIPVSDFIMGITLSGTSVDQWENIEQWYIMTQRIIQHNVHIMENKAHCLALNLDCFIQ